MYFRHFIIIFPWKRAWPFFWTNLYPLHPRMLCAKFGWNWPSGSGEEDENVKGLRQQRRQTNFDQNLRLRWANNVSSFIHKYVWYNKVYLSQDRSARKHPFPISTHLGSKKGLQLCVIQTADEKRTVHSKFFFYAQKFIHIGIYHSVQIWKQF